MHFKRILLLSLTGVCYHPFIHASPIGINYSQVIVSSEPENLHGYHIAINYQPEKLIWPHLQVYFDASYSHWWMVKHMKNQNVSIYSLAPYLRLYFFKHNTISPYVQLSLGVAYLSHTRIHNRNLGMHFSFQDQIGIGMAFGKEQRLTTTVSAFHYSNGAFCGNNSGITVPVMLSVGYRF